VLNVIRDSIEIDFDNVREYRTTKVALTQVKTMRVYRLFLLILFVTMRIFAYYLKLA
jgi:hypothetical protein